MSKLTIVAQFTVAADRIDQVKAEWAKLIPATRAEDGCIQYDLHQDNDNPNRYLFFENWESRDHWLAHMDAPHLLGYREATQGAISEFTIKEMTHIA